jgi:hypothetical protein
VKDPPAAPTSSGTSTTSTGTSTTTSEDGRCWESV